MNNKKQVNLTIQLTDKDMKTFLQKCYEARTTPSEVLTGFLNDLVNGYYTRGSDERDLAQQYFDRCGYPYSGALTFTQYLLELGGWRLEEVEEAIDDIETAEEEFRYYEENPEDPPTESELDYWKNTMKHAKEVLEEHYTDYKKESSNPENLENGIKSVKEYLQKIKTDVKNGQIT